MQEKTRDNKLLIKSVETLQVKTGIIIHVADFVQPNFYFVNFEVLYLVTPLPVREREEGSGEFAAEKL